ncbi:MAG: hypothetical protein R3C05_26220 [Pirellulaceae bacterium]
MANYKITNKDSIVREDEIYDWFVNADNAKLCEYKEKPFEFVREDHSQRRELRLHASEKRQSTSQPKFALGACCRAKGHRLA